MGIMDKLGSIIGSEEYVIQTYDDMSMTWDDIGVVDEVLGPEDYDLPDGKSRLVCRKGDKIKNIVWTTSSQKPAPERKERRKKKRSAIDDIQSKAERIRKDREKLLDIKDMLDDIVGVSSEDTTPKHEEWQYPSMITGLNKGIGHAFLLGMDEKKGEIASAGLELVQGFSNVMSAIPVLAVAYAKSKGVNVGLFGIDEGSMFPHQQHSQPSQPVSNGTMKERDDGFDVDTIGEEDEEYDDEEYGDEEYDLDDYIEPISDDPRGKSDDVDLSMSDKTIHEYTIDSRYRREDESTDEGDVSSDDETTSGEDDNLQDDSGSEYDDPDKIIYSEDELPPDDEDEMSDEDEIDEDEV